MKRIIFPILLICFVSSALCASKSGIVRELSRSSSTSFEFQAVKNGTVNDEVWKPEITVSNSWGTEQEIVSGEEIKVGVDDLTTDWKEIFKIVYSSNSLKYPIRFNVSIAPFTNGIDVIPIDGLIEYDSNFDIHDSKAHSVKESDFESKYFNSNLPSGDNQKGFDDNNDKDHLIFRDLEINSVSTDDSTLIRYSYTTLWGATNYVYADFVYTATAFIRLDSSAFVTKEKKVDQTKYSGGEYRMNVLLTVEAEA